MRRAHAELVRAMARSIVVRALRATENGRSVGGAGDATIGIEGSNPPPATNPQFSKGDHITAQRSKRNTGAELQIAAKPALDCPN